MTFDFTTLEEVLLCPKSKSKLILDDESLVCVDPECRLQFQILDEIPIMLIDEATELSVEEWEAIMRKQDQWSPTEFAEKCRNNNIKWVSVSRE